MKTPPRSTKKMNRRSLVTSPSPLYRTPINMMTPSRRCARGSSLAKLQASSTVTPRGTTRKLSTTRKRTKKSTPLEYYGDGDRFIPNRRKMNVGLCRRLLLSDDDDDSKNENNHNNNGQGDEEVAVSATDNNNNNNKSKTHAEMSLEKEYKRQVLSSLCNVPLDMLDKDARPKSLFGYNHYYISGGQEKASSPCFTRIMDPSSLDHLRFLQHFDNSATASSKKNLIGRDLPDKPKQILDVPGLLDDYYLDLMSWNKDNILAVLIAQDVYLWNATTKTCQILTTLEGGGHYGTSVAWYSLPGVRCKYLAIGTSWDEVQIWDTEARRLVRTFYGHTGRVTALDWHQHCLSSGGQDSLILQHDLRSPQHFISTYKGHDDDVCGLKWNEEGTTLVSGGNDNVACIWDAAMTSSQRRMGYYPPPASAQTPPRLRFEAHTGTVKALDWCPFKRGVLASGGGRDDQTIKIWNSNSGAVLSSVDTFSQVCSVMWSKREREICSAHGSPRNQITLWKYGKEARLNPVKNFVEQHTSRVLTLAQSPDGATVASISGDDVLCFWDIFGSPSTRRTASMPMGELSFGPSIR